MRRQDTWIELADRLVMDRATVVAVCAFLNLRRDPAWIEEQLEIGMNAVLTIAEAAKPLLRQPRNAKRERADPEGRVCAYCGIGKGLTRDHVQPRSRGGSNEPSNIVLACRNCNSAKGARTPAEWLG